MRPFRFGVIVRSAGSRAEWGDQARKLEDLGYSSLTVPDHLAETFAPMPALVSAAAATKTIRVGTTVLNNHFRHPVLVAREAVAVDLPTDGRLELGLGAGNGESEYEQAGRALRSGRRPYGLVGTVDQLVEELQARRTRWGISYFVTHEPYVDAFAPVVARLGGK
jgi:alkanesulfonate monooxygenase SsuD/methylene tetrahydromethanopterin reductase-like flavin-dependent oxidoreductase (luciferase family)